MRTANAILLDIKEERAKISDGQTTSETFNSITRIMALVEELCEVTATYAVRAKQAAESRK